MSIECTQCPLFIKLKAYRPTTSYLFRKLIALRCVAGFLTRPIQSNYFFLLVVTSFLIKDLVLNFVFLKKNCKCRTLFGLFAYVSDVHLSWTQKVLSLQVVILTKLGTLTCFERRTSIMDINGLSPAIFTTDPHPYNIWSIKSSKIQLSTFWATLYHFDRLNWYEQFGSDWSIYLSFL